MEPFTGEAVSYANKTDNRQKPLCKSYINVIQDVNFSLQMNSTLSCVISRILLLFVKARQIDFCKLPYKSYFYF